jgi:hypothetical protein
MKKLLITPLLILLALIYTAGALAGPQASKTIANHNVYYSAFNSSFIQPEVAATYNITRGKNRGLVNIAAVPLDNEAGGGRSAFVKGSVSNMLGQSQILKFIEVREGDVVYYLATFKFDDEDSLTFKISVKPDPNKAAESITFQNKFYYD